MNILFASPEVAPFAKTGGLGDVAGALPKALHAMGHDAAVVLPAYRRGDEPSLQGEPAGLAFDVPVGDGLEPASILRSTLPGTAVPVYLVDHKGFFDRPNLFKYDSGQDYEDNSARFVFFSRAVCELARRLPMPPNVIHCNDWQTGLVPVYMRCMYHHDDRIGETASVFTIHNIAYQGVFWHWDMKLTGLDWSLFDWRALECNGKLNFLKAGIVFADVINTVSPTYSREILAEPAARGLDAPLRSREADLYGVMNGVDYSVWNPQDDPLIAAHYSAANKAGKQACKAELQRRTGLPLSTAPLVGMVTRLAEEKGMDLVLAGFDRLMERDLQFVLLGTGEPHYEVRCANAGTHHADKAAFVIAFDETWAHRIVAGADMFLMPSLTEPSGLTQLYSLKYGTVPVVRRTGGLVDTVLPYSPDRQAGEATGFAFDGMSPDGLLAAVDQALAVCHRPEEWSQIMDAGMAQDWSWARSAAAYDQLYAIARASECRECRLGRGRVMDSPGDCPGRRRPSP